MLMLIAIPQPLEGREMCTHKVNFLGQPIQLMPILFSLLPELPLEEFYLCLHGDEPWGTVFLIGLVITGTEIIVVTSLNICSS